MKKMIFVLLIPVIVSASFFVFATVEDEVYKLPVIMYHSILNEGTNQGDYVVSLQKFESDILYLKNNGFETVTVNDLVAYVYDGKPLPKKPVMITFDDGFYNNILYAGQILERYGMKGVLSVVGSYTEEFTKSGDKNPAYAYISATDIEKIQSLGVFEIQNHSYDMHKITAEGIGSIIKKGENSIAYRDRFCLDTVKMQKLLMKMGINSYCYTYPYGKYCTQSEEYIRKLGFRASLSCDEGINYINRDPECLYLLKRYNRSGGHYTEAFFSKILSSY